MEMTCTQCGEIFHHYGPTDDETRIYCKDCEYEIIQQINWERTNQNDEN